MNLKNITEEYKKRPKIQVGNMLIGEGIQKGKIWLEIVEEEGGDFPPEQVEKVLRKYFDKHF